MAAACSNGVDQDKDGKVEASSYGWAGTHLGALWYLRPSQPWHSLSRLKACNMNINGLRA